MATLFSGKCLQPGQSLQSNNRLHTLTMQSDGNVVLYNQHSQPIWATNTDGLITPRDFIMQTDGNLVLYDKTGSPKWASNTSNNPGAFLNIQDDGNLVVYRSGAQTETADNALWAAGSNDIQGTGGQSTPSAPSGGMAQEILKAHNYYRSQVGVPPLTWSDALARDAQERAKLLSDSGRFEHLGNTHGEGENLWKGTSGAYSFAQMINSFGEEPHYNDGRNYNHYTQMVWRKTTDVGCAVFDNSRDTILVCRYSPTGNMIGEKAY